MVWTCGGRCDASERAVTLMSSGSISARLMSPISSSPLDSIALCSFIASGIGSGTSADDKWRDRWCSDRWLRLWNHNLVAAKKQIKSVFIGFWFEVSLTLGKNISISIGLTVSWQRTMYNKNIWSGWRSGCSQKTWRTTYALSDTTVSKYIDNESGHFSL